MAKTPFKRYNRDYKSLLSGRSLDAGVTGFAETLSKGLMSIYEDKEREDTSEANFLKNMLNNAVGTSTQASAQDKAAHNQVMSILEVTDTDISAYDSMYNMVRHGGYSTTQITKWLESGEFFRELPQFEKYTLGQKVYPEYAELDAALGKSESGQNWASETPFEDKDDPSRRGYSGYLNFGTARLQDFKNAHKGQSFAGVQDLSKFTKEEFKKNKDLQRYVGNWHYKDIEKYIRSDLNDYIGKEFMGVKLDIQNMIPVAHLGGKGGLKKFLTSGGDYNPDDGAVSGLGKGNGTKLSDYLLKFSNKLNDKSKLKNLNLDEMEASAAGSTLEWESKFKPNSNVMRKFTKYAQNVHGMTVTDAMTMVKSKGLNVSDTGELDYKGWKLDLAAVGGDTTTVIDMMKDSINIKTEEGLKRWKTAILMVKGIDETAYSKLDTNDPFKKLVEGVMGGYAKSSDLQRELDDLDKNILSVRLDKLKKEVKNYDEVFNIQKRRIALAEAKFRVNGDQEAFDQTMAMLNAEVEEEKIAFNEMDKDRKFELMQEKFNHLKNEAKIAREIVQKSRSPKEQYDYNFFSSKQYREAEAEATGPDAARGQEKLNQLIAQHELKWKSLTRGVDEIIGNMTDSSTAYPMFLQSKDSIVLTDQEKLQVQEHWFSLQRKKINELFPLGKKPVFLVNIGTGEKILAKEIRGKYDLPNDNPDTPDVNEAHFYKDYKETYKLIHATTGTNQGDSVIIDVDADGGWRKLEESENDRYVDIGNHVATNHSDHWERSINTADALRLSHKALKLLESEPLVGTWMGDAVANVAGFFRESNNLLAVVDRFLQSDAVGGERVSQAQIEEHLQQEGYLPQGATLDDIATGNSSLGEAANKINQFQALVLKTGFRFGKLEGQQGNGLSNNDFQNSIKSIFIGSREAIRENLISYMKSYVQKNDDGAFALANDSKIQTFIKDYGYSPLEIVTTNFREFVQARNENTLTEAYNVIVMGEVGQPSEANTGEDPVMTFEQFKAMSRNAGKSDEELRPEYEVLYGSGS